MNNARFGTSLLMIMILSTINLGARTSARADYESAPYQVVEQQDAFEIREYPDLMLASTKMRFAARGSDGSFMRLFGYISGRNEAKQKVEMTTPVFMEMEAGQTEGKMGFVMPRDVAEQGVPVPKDEAVEIRKRDGGRFAVVRFAGRMNPELAAAEESKLRTWMKQRGFEAAGPAEAASYDSPMTPGPMRRNEILIRLPKPEAR